MAFTAAERSKTKQLLYSVIVPIATRVGYLLTKAEAKQDL